MMIIQLNPPIPLSTPKGNGLAWLVLDYGAEHNLMWTVAINDTREIWTFSNVEVRAQKNVTMGRKFTFPKPSDTFKGAIIMDDPGYGGKLTEEEIKKIMIKQTKSEQDPKQSDIQERQDKCQHFFPFGWEKCKLCGIKRNVSIFKQAYSGKSNPQSQEHDSRFDPNSP